MSLEPTSLTIESLRCLLPVFFFSNSARIEHVPPQAGQLSIHFLNKEISSVTPPRGTVLWTHYREKERLKSPAPRVKQTHDLLSFCCRGVRSTAVLQSLPSLTGILNTSIIDTKMLYLLINS